MTLKFDLSMTCAGDAFADFPTEEIARILSAVGDSLEAGNTRGTCRDSNGNNVGRWTLAEGDA